VVRFGCYAIDCHNCAVATSLSMAFEHRAAGFTDEADWLNRRIKTIAADD
jgi:hypothetical protein